MKEIKEVFIVIDEENIIQKALERTIIIEKGKSTWTTRSKNFNEEFDFENAISVNIDFDEIVVGETEYIIEEGETEEGE